MGSFLRPDRLDDALAALGAKPWTVLAGGTDHYPARAAYEPDEDILDITALPGLRRIERCGGDWRIPALATWTDLIGADLPSQFSGLRAAARQVGGWQIQNAGTLVGNVCNASPAADGMPNLLALDARIELRSREGVRSLPLAEFVLGPRRTALRCNELATAILMPELDAASVFLKLGARRYLVISAAMAALVLERDGAGRIRSARAAVGACGPVAARLPGLEAALVGQFPDPDLLRPEHLQPLRPISDVRGTAEYRTEAALELVRRALSGFAMEMTA